MNWLPFLNNRFMEDRTLNKTDTKSFRGRWIDYVYTLQERICEALEKIDDRAKFAEDDWQRAEGRGGGGRTRVMANGNIFEKGGVNVSVVYGHVTDNMRKHLQLDGDTWFACGLSLVIHPLNPFVPTTHANWRYFELHHTDGTIRDRWFGGGTDLTPYYLFEEDVAHFHGSLKNTIDVFGEELYPLYKKQCDAYFSNKHRGNEMRGVGGVFYDHLRPADEEDAERLLAFQFANGNNFTSAYLPIVNKRKDMPWNAKHKHWQEIRRGRYVEFNLIHDRGTLFGLKTHGRTESILMSLPPTVRFEYDYQPDPGTDEAKLLDACLHPREWV